jgi:uncharacterized protein YggE
VADVNRIVRVGSALAAAAVLIAAAPRLAPVRIDTASTIVETTATATVQFPPDRLFIAVDVEAEAGAPVAIDEKKLDLAVARITAAGIPASAVLQRYVTTAPARWRRISTDIDTHPYGIVLLQFPKPARTALVTLTEHTLTAAFEEPLDDDSFAEVGGAWYGLDDCRRLRIAARKGALALARERGELLARAAGFVVDAAGVRAAATAESAGTDSPESAQSYLCGRNTLPDVSPPQLHTSIAASELNGFVEEESTMTVDWPTLPLVAPRPLTVPNRLSSLGDAVDDDDAQPAKLVPGTVRAIVSVSAADVTGGSGCTYDRALGAALAVATRRAASAGRTVGLVPDRPLTIVDETDYRGACPAHGPIEGPETARVAESFTVIGARRRPGTETYLEARGTARVGVPAERARVVAAVTPAAGIGPSDAVARLVAAGVEKTTLHVSGGSSLAIDGYVVHPTAALMTAIDAALVALAPAGTPPARTFAYALGDCSALNERVLRAAVSAAQSSGRADAAARGAHLHGVSALEAGPIHVRNCGPHVLEQLPLTPQAGPPVAPDTTAAVTADAGARLLYAL